MAAMVVCIVLLILAALIFMLLIAGWVYLDAKEHGERGWMWVCIILLSSPILGGLIYLIARREERLPCRFCGWMVNKNANYCEHCGQKAPVCEEGSRIFAGSSGRGALRRSCTQTKEKKT